MYISACCKEGAQVDDAGANLDIMEFNALYTSGDHRVQTVGHLSLCYTQNLLIAGDNRSL